MIGVMQTGYDTAGDLPAGLRTVDRGDDPVAEAGWASHRSPADGPADPQASRHVTDAALPWGPA